MEGGKKIPLNLPIICFILAFVLSSLLFQSPLIGLEKTEAIIRRIALYYLVVFGVKDRVMAKKLIYLLLISSAIWAVYIILQYMWDIELFNIIIPASKNIGAARSIGETLGMIIPISLCYFLFASSLSQRIWLGTILLLLTSLLLLTLTRGAWLGLIFAIIFIATIKNKRIWLFILFFLIIAFLFPVTRNRVISIFDLKNSSNRYRIHMWKEGLKTFKNNPLFGIGSGNFKGPYGKEVSSHCHNNFLNVAVETGLTGLIVFIWLINACYRLVAKSIKDMDVLKIGLSAGLIDWFVHGMVDVPYTGRMGYLFWFFVGMIVVINKVEYESK